jgi:hypothetical protein
MRLAWPDGGSYLSQPAVTVHVFNMITDQMVKSSSQK